MGSEPEWSLATSKSGYLEVLKGGKIIETIPINFGIKCLTIGRLPDNSITLDHDSISRRHATIQFGPKNTAFVLDLSSTHGTFLNKKRIPSNQYVKFSSGNDLISFGASTRFFLLKLEEDGDQSQTFIKPKFRDIMLSFFAANGIASKDVIIVKTGEIISASLDFCEYISIDSSEPSIITSSGATKDEALERFYEDSFNFLSLLGLISNPKSDTEPDFSDADDFFDDANSQDVIPIPSNKALSEEQLLLIVKQSKTQMESIKKEIDVLKDALIILEQEIVDDFDVYIQDIKKTEIQNDIQKHTIKFDNFKKVIKISELFILKIFNFIRNA